MTELGAKEVDKLFCMASKKYGLKKTLLKAVAMAESAMNQTAYRYEGDFFRRYLANNPEWKDQDPSIVSASYGLFQLMWTTAWGLGFRGTQEDLWNPVFNIELGAKYLRILFDKVRTKKAWGDGPAWDIEIVLATYNGGSRDNPDAKGKLRNQKYVDRVFELYHDIKRKEKDCPDD